MVVFSGRPTVATIDLNALQWNFRQVRRLVGPRVQVMAVVKANAYGHGAIACSRALAVAGANAFGVATTEEGVVLRQAGIRQPIIILGLTQPNEAASIIQHGLQPTIISWEQARALAQAAGSSKRANVHVKVDTGMGRIGLLPAEIGGFARRLRTFKRLHVAGLFTHFAHADGRDRKLLHQQMERLDSATAAMHTVGWENVMVHAANSAAILEAPETYRNLVRPGLMLYGLYPAERFRSIAELRPVLRWTTRILQLKTVPPATGLSYGHTFITRRNSRIATLPVGYADGFLRRFSNRGKVLVRGQACPIVGRVCMDMCLADVTDVAGVKLGDEAVLIGSQRTAQRTADDLAKDLDTISYEVLCGIGARVPRQFKERR